MKIIASITAALFTLLPFIALAAPTLADTPNITNHHFNGVSDSFSYTVPAGTNQVLILRLHQGTHDTMSATQNGVALTMVTTASCSVAGFEDYGYLVAPTSGTFQITGGGGTQKDYFVMTVNGASQTSPVDTAACTNITGTNVSTAVTPTNANTLLMGLVFGSNTAGSSHGASQTEFVNVDNTALLEYAYGSYVTGSSTPSTLQRMSEVWTLSRSLDYQVIAIAPSGAAAGAATPPKRRPIFFQ